MIQDFQDNLVLSDQIKNLSGWITLTHSKYGSSLFSNTVKLLGPTVAYFWSTVAILGTIVDTRATPG